MFGPSSPRGTAGVAADGMFSPWIYVGGVGVVHGVPGYREVNDASLSLGEYESFKNATPDPYLAMGSAYHERRAGGVEKGKSMKQHPKGGGDPALAGR